MKDFLTAKEIDILQVGHHIERFRRSADKIKASLLVHKGMTYSHIAEILMLDEGTIRRYEKAYKENGVDGLLESRYHGSTGFLSITEEETLTKHLQMHTYQTVKEVVGYVARE